MSSAYRTEAQKLKLANALAAGYVWSRDSEYRLTAMRRAGCLMVLFGRVTGEERSMIIYPDGSVETAKRKRGGSARVNFSKTKMGAALLSHGVLLDVQPVVRRRRMSSMYRSATPRGAMAYADEDEMFQIESHQP